MANKRSLEKKITDLDRIIQASSRKIVDLGRKIHSNQNSELGNVWNDSVKYKNSVQATVDDFLAETIDQAQENILRGLHEAEIYVESWSSRNWGNFNLPAKKTLVEYVRIGELVPLNLVSEIPPIPALLPLIKSNHLLTFHPRQLANEGAQLLSSIVWRIVCASSPENYRFIFIDTFDRGRSFASALNLPEIVRGNKIYCQEHEIEFILKKCVDDMEEIIQRRLREIYDNVEDYNKANPLTSIPYHYLVFTGFPDGFSDSAINLLLSIARSGIRSGYYLIGGLFTGEYPGIDKLLPRFIEQSSIIYLDQHNQARWDDPLFAHMPIKLDQPPSKELTELVSLLVKDAVEKISDVIEFARLATELSGWMKCSSEIGLIIPIGLNQNGTLSNIELGPSIETFHGLVGGRIGSGKTNFLHALILSLCLNYSNEEIQLYLVDFKEGVEFQDYVNYQLPQARAIVIEAEREFGLSVLEYLEEEMSRRGEEFKGVGVNVVNIENYRTQTRRKMPRILAVFDEFVKLFEEDDVIADRAYQALLHIAQRGRAFGIHLVLAAQRPVGSFQNLNPVKSQIGLRVAFKCNEPDDSALILGERNEKAAYLEGTGIACITYDPTLQDKTKTVRIAYVSQDDRKLYLESIRKVSSEHIPSVAWDAIVFKKWEPAFWKDTRSIRELLYNRTNNVAQRFWLGQPVRLADDQSFTFSSIEGENALILGINDQLVFQSMIHMLMGLALTSYPQKAEFIWLTATNSYPNGNEIITAFNKLPHSIQLVNEQDIYSILEELNDRLETRLKEFIDPPQIYLFIPGLHRLPKFRNHQDCSDYPIGELLEKILQRGSPLGIHIILWTDRFETLHCLPSINIVDYFNHRIAFHTTIDDSNQFLGVSDASRLGQEKRLLYRHQSWPERAVEKIKPYELPTIEEFRKVIGQISHIWEM